MKLYIRQRVFSLTDRYDIYDEFENPYFHVQSEFLTLTPKLHLYDQTGAEVYFIKRKLTFWLASYEIYRQGTYCAGIQQQFRWFRSHLTVESPYGRMEIRGSFWEMQYEIFCGGIFVGAVRKKWLSWGDSYELEIADESDPGFFCALVIAIDNCIHNGQNS